MDTNLRLFLICSKVFETFYNFLIFYYWLGLFFVLDIASFSKKIILNLCINKVYGLGSIFLLIKS